MATFQSIGITLCAGSVVGLSSIALFGIAVRQQSSFVAPRAAARPRNVIYNPTAPRDSEQYRGGPTFGWISWTMQLTYAQLLAGVPGTGTRQDGNSGSFLQVNLDGIILLRFHALCTRIALVASLLCVGLLLPLYYTAANAQQGCHGAANATSNGTSIFNNETIDYNCTDATTFISNLTDYERTTIANVHPYYGDRFDLRIILSRLYVTAFSFWIILLYILYLLHREWIQILAMRRVYYLEYDVWGERRKELKTTMLHQENTQPVTRQYSSRHLNVQQDNKDDDNNDGHANNEDDCLIDREPWIPHPEQRDTVPNVALYSLLVGGLPSLPVESGEGVDAEEAVNFGRRESMDWQLSLTTTFFDHCVPNMPGYSSSVAAVTILPAASEMTLAWRKWYAAASKLRRLRFVRKQIQIKRKQMQLQGGSGLKQIDEQDDDEEDEANDDKTNTMDNCDIHATNGIIQEEDSEEENDENVYEEDSLARDTGMHPRDLEKGERIITSSDGSPTTVYTPRPIYMNLANDHKKAYYQQVFGSVADDDTIDYDMYNPWSFGPEQAAVYSREFAQAAAPCCPYGCHQERIEDASLDTLLDLEQDAVEEFHQANLELREMRRRVALADIIAEVEKEAEEADVEKPAPLDETKEEALKDMSLVPGRPAPVKRDTSINEISPNLSPARPATATRGRSIETNRMGSNLKLEATMYQQSASFHESSPTSPNNEFVDVSNRGRFESDADRVRTVSDAEWAMVLSIISESTSDAKKRAGLRASVASGRYSLRKPNLKWLKDVVAGTVKEIKGWAKTQSVEAIDTLARHSTYAVVTFTSRQAAVAARNCLADGRGAGRWNNLSGMPIPPLADAAPFDLVACRNCCRPVTVSIPDRQKNARRYIAMGLLVLIYVFYTIPLTTASQLVSYAQLDSLFPQITSWTQSAFGFSITHLLSGLISACIYTTFFALCPSMFKSIANFGSGAVSVSHAEFKALQYYWWFMVVTAFTGQLLANMVIDGFKEGSIGTEFAAVLRQVATTIPSTLSATWLNWIIFRVTLTLPMNYLLNVNTFAFACLGWNCCSRMVRGGGPGGPLPYRLYVDTGTVLMCCVALGPSSPLVSLVCLMYFIVMEPLMRRNLIFVYRPKFDSGGARWPFIFDMFISVMIVGSILLTTQMALKQAVGPAVLSAIPILPIYLFQQSMKGKFLRAFSDAALLQTSLLDGWDTTAETGAERREEFRRFLVDAHKAAYVPVCIAGTDTDRFITAEPAVVIPLPDDSDRFTAMTEVPSEDPMLVPTLDQGPFFGSQDEDDVHPMPIPAPTPIHGGILRRPPLTQTDSSRRRAYSSGAVLMGNSSVSFGHRDSLSPSDASGTYGANIGTGRGTPRRGSIFQAKSIYRDFSDGKSE
ncbi:hypothetical protein MPSEU_000121700 [Mayamaea pseudoterrestris]|nr:hypothetical protein MPSEU_000121700 [Mayamaea pseudoterrestris]